MQTKLAQGTLLLICVLHLPALVAWAGDMDNPPRLINPPPQQTCVTNWCEVIHAPSGQMFFTNIVVWPESPVCLGTTLYAIPIMGSSCDDAIIDNRWDPPSTNCPAHTLYTNPYGPYSITNWWVVSGPGGFQASGEGLGVGFTPTNCGDGSITFQPLQECSGGFSLGGIRVQPAEGMLGDQSGPVQVRRAPAGACSPEPRRDVHAPKPCPNEARHSTERPFLAPALDEPRPTICPADPL